MKRATLIVLLSLTIFGSAIAAQTTSSTPLPPDKQANRDATREKLRALLADNAVKILGVPVKQSDKNPYNFSGMTESAYKNVKGFEIVIGVSTDETIGFRIYPRYGAGYINIDKARNPAALMRQMVTLSNHNFLFWGADDTGDVFAGYTITLESGFPDEAIKVILYSVKPLDQYVGQMRANIDGSTGVP